MEAVPDTGSFDFLVFGSKCQTGCGPVDNLYNQSKSGSFHKGETYTLHEFGSGDAWASESYDVLKVGPLQVEKQLFWQVYSADMPILRSGDFQGILGIGPPESSVTIALNDAKEVRKEIKEIEKYGQVTPDQQKIAENYFALAKHAKKAVSVAANLDLESFSICLGRRSGSKGYLVWHDTAPQDRPTNMFRTVPVQEGLFWAAALESVQLGALPGASDGQHSTPIGCSDGPCTAIVDSGTSLLVAPSSAAWQVEEALDKWRALSGNCTDLSSLPNLEFKMGGIPFTLPPESYVGDVSGDWEKLDPDLRRYLPHFERKMQSLKSGSEFQGFDACTPLLMVMDSSFDNVPVWILGMPFFRQYYTTFTLGPGPEPWRRSAKSMSFAHSDAKCKPVAAEQLLREAEAPSEERRLRIDISKLRIPHWVKRKAPSLSDV